jgi:hypothetical protein
VFIKKAREVLEGWKPSASDICGATGGCCTLIFVSQRREVCSIGSVGPRRRQSTGICAVLVFFTRQNGPDPIEAQVQREAVASRGLQRSDQPPLLFTSAPRRGPPMAAALSCSCSSAGVFTAGASPLALALSPPFPCAVEHTTVKQ